MDPLSFTKKVIAVVQGIPAGTTMTYREVAVAAGRPRAYRAVGNILNTTWQTDHGETVPCHRVVRSGGGLGGYAGGTKVKQARLQAEQNKHQKIG
ncbi:MGMT family protein [Candidatus Berkelbacteria bacterium]|nr:MGMT family protein [Candidatus Berkelbacteria bacterium]